jgi:hypothetical protein
MALECGMSAPLLLAVSEFGSKSKAVLTHRTPHQRRMASWYVTSAAEYANAVM